MSQGLHQSSSFTTSGQEFPQRTSLPSGLLASDWNPSWLLNDGFASPSVTSSRPFVKTYSPSSWPGITFYQLPRPDSYVASDVVLCIIKSTSSTRTARHWDHLYSELHRMFDGCTFLVRTESSAFLPVDDFSVFVALLQKTHAPYISLEVQLLRPSFALTPCPTLRKWHRLIIKQFVPHRNSHVFGTTSSLRLIFSPHERDSTLCMYLDASKSSPGDTEFIMAVIDGLLSSDAMIMLDDLCVEGSYAPLVVEGLPALLGDNRLLRLRGLPAIHSVAYTPITLCVKLPSALVLDLSSPYAINTFVSWLPSISTSSSNARRARPPDIYLCFKYNAVVGTEDPAIWSRLDNILAGHILAPFAIQSLDVFNDGLDSYLEALLKYLLPRAADTVIAMLR